MAETQGTGASVRYRDTDEVDFVIVGAGAAGGVVARELSVAGFRVVVLEQGPYLREGDFHHDELGVTMLAALTNDFHVSPNTLRKNANETAKVAEAVKYGRLVGGGSVHDTGNSWRLHEIDFIERSRTGAVAGADRDDWPLTYSELEPYYTRVEWEIGVSGLAGASPFDPPRSRPYPLPPLPIKSLGVLAERGAKKMGPPSLLRWQSSRVRTRVERRASTAVSARRSDARCVRSRAHSSR